MIRDILLYLSPLKYNNGLLRDGYTNLQRLPVGEAAVGLVPELYLGFAAYPA